ncbi:MAG: heavy metal translocating P-type ATPase [Candidatus Uhrbacteria bacterium]
MPLLIVVGFIAYGLLLFFGYSDIARVVLILLIIGGVIPNIWRMLVAIREGRFGIDIVALIAIFSSLALDQLLAGSIILFMLVGGEALEDFALARARLQLTRLLSRAPSIAHRMHGKIIEDIAAEHVLVEDALLVKAGETVPVDGLVVDGQPTIDESMITGEPLPVEKKRSQQVVSGSVNVGLAFTMHATRESKNSKYQQIVRMVRDAEEQRAPIVRLADRYSLGFTIITLTIAGAAWFFSRDPVLALAVLVVATPCPLIIATPTAVMSGVSLAAKRGIVVKNGGALEALARVKAFAFDKTGTITFGEPAVSHVVAYAGSERDVLMRAASLDQISGHILSRSLVKAAQKLKVPLVFPLKVEEVLGQGLVGLLEQKKYALGRYDFMKKLGIVVPKQGMIEREACAFSGKKIIFLAQGKRALGSVAFSDTVRAETKTVFSRLRDQGIQEIVLLSGDRTAVVKQVASKVGISQALGGLSPKDKVTELKRLKKRFSSIAMVGDGVNDAPVLAAADVGIALGSHGMTAASETADIVIVVDKLSRVQEAHAIAQRTIRVATQGIYIGIGTSILLMIIASFGFIPPVMGAFLQELLDVVVIMNALRVQFVRR